MSQAFDICESNLHGDNIIAAIEKRVEDSSVKMLVATFFKDLKTLVS